MKKPAKASSQLLAHLRRELFHTVWFELLDDEFVEAYRNGIVVKCGDRIWRRIYLRLISYSADYPEK
jgi:hypothetical protein